MTLPEPYFNSQKTSFAHPSVRERWPVILTAVIDDVSKTVGKITSSDTSKADEGKEIIRAVSDLLYEMDHDRELTPLEIPEKEASSPLFADIADYNEGIAQLKKESPHASTWHTAPWLISECYMYRRLAFIFQIRQQWSNYDYFADSKRSAFSSSKDGVVELTLRYKQLSQQLADSEANGKDKSDILEELFKEFIDISLWGNATDLSLLANVSLDEIKRLQGAEVRRANEANILVNDTTKAWNRLYKPFSEGKKNRVDFVLDNAGFELFTDVVFALFLLDSKIAHSIVLHPKNIPWFVSDVMPHDFHDLLVDLTDASFFSEQVSPEHREALDYLAGKLESYFKPGNAAESEEGGIFIHTSDFWTTQYNFNSDLTPEGRGTGDRAYKDLSHSTLVYFKGDLNHRKLIGDLQWPRTTPFVDAVGLKGSDQKNTLANGGISIMTLRTIKGDTLTGLKEGQEASLNEQWWKKQNEKGDKEVVERGWAYSGKWAVIEYSEGK